jgi:hypothetical protein
MARHGGAPVVPAAFAGTRYGLEHWRGSVPGSGTGPIHEPRVCSRLIPRMGRFVLCHRNNELPLACHDGHASGSVVSDNRVARLPRRMVRSHCHLTASRFSSLGQSRSNGFALTATGWSRKRPTYFDLRPTKAAGRIAWGSVGVAIESYAGNQIISDDRLAGRSLQRQIAKLSEPLELWGRVHGTLHCDVQCSFSANSNPVRVGASL